MAEQGKQGVLFDDRFLEDYVGKNILHNKIIAIMELIANAWDAGATKVKIVWPVESGSEFFKIEDNGHGMTENQLIRRWSTLSYNRRQEQGNKAEFPRDVELPERTAFGKNGKGRFAGFCFGNQYLVSTKRDGKKITYRINKGNDNVPFDLNKVGEEDSEGHGTEIVVNNPKFLSKNAQEIRAEIGMRFLTDPNFEVYLQGEQITFRDIPEIHKEELTIEIDEIGDVQIFVIDTHETDPTTKQHGIAWHVNGRLVGECSWQGSGQETLIDGRRIPAKRYTFIIFANCLEEAVLPDWSGFDPDNKDFEKVNEKVQQRIRKILLDFTKERRKETFARVSNANKDKLKKMGPKSKEKWDVFVTKVQENCPSIREDDLTELSGILATLEVSNYQYSLINKLHELKPDQLDNLHEILDDWTIDVAKDVLNELQARVQLIDELRKKISDPQTDEVQDLQPLFHRGLWIFGPEYETIEYTSNEGMTKVIQNIFGKDSKGSLNRPDFAILPNSSIGLYSYPKYDNDGGEIGVDKLTIVELKKPTVTIGTDEKGQCWKYVKELYEHGHLDERTNVSCFALGTRIDQNEMAERTEKDGRVIIKPMRYNTVLERAKSRMLKLYDRIKNAPFLNKEEIDKYLEKDTNIEKQEELDLS